MNVEEIEMDEEVRGCGRGGEGEEILPLLFFFFLSSACRGSPAVYPYVTSRGRLFASKTITPDAIRNGVQPRSAGADPRRSKDKWR